MLGGEYTYMQRVTDGEGGLVPQGWDRVYNEEGESGASQLSVPPSPTPFPSSPSPLVTIILVLALFCIPEEKKHQRMRYTFGLSQSILPIEILFESSHSFE